MEHRATIFVEAMVVVAVIGVLAFLIGLITRLPNRQKAGPRGADQPEQSPRWYEFTLALILLAAVAAFVLWIISSGTHWVWGETIGDWRSDTQTVVFTAVMVALAIIGLVISFAYAIVQSSQSQGSRRTPETTAMAQAPPASAAQPSPLRVLGLLALVIAILLLCWIALPPASQYVLMANLIFPAGLAVALVLLFDKATRTWGTKGGAESLREWFICDLLVFLFVLAFLNLRNVAKPDVYAGSFWDLLDVVLFFVAFWVMDRTAGRGRFLVGYGYLVVLPLLFLVWQSVEGIAGAASWWASVWPFLILAAVFLVLEIVTLISSTGERQTLPAVKDAIFVATYAALLIVAAKSV